MSASEAAAVGSPVPILEASLEDDDDEEVMLPADISFRAEPLCGPDGWKRFCRRARECRGWLCVGKGAWARRVAAFFVSPFFFSVCWFLFCMYWNCVLQVVAEKRILMWALEISFGSDEMLLPDLGFAVTPRIPTDYLADWWCYGIIVFTLLRFVLTPMRGTIIRRYVLVLGVLFLLRGVTIVLTTLPNPQTTCVATATGNTWIEGFLIMFGIHKTCRDMFFSGHTVNMTIACLCWGRYSHVVPICQCDECESEYCHRALTKNGYLQRCTTMKVLIWAPYSIGIFLIIATRLHYSIDVLTAALLTLLTWEVYHHFITVAHLHGNRFLMWLERGAPDLNIVSVPAHDLSSTASV